MTRISNYHVGLSMDASGLIKAGQLSRHELAAVNRSMGEMITPTEKAAFKIQALEKAMQHAGAESAHFARAIQHQKQAMQDLANVSSGPGGSGGVLGNLLGGATGRLGLNALGAGAIGAGAVGAVAWAANYAEQLEVANMNFSVLLGSQEKANKMLTEMKKLGAETPLDLGGITKTGQMLVQFGIDADKVVPTIRMMGDVVGGSQERLDRLAYQLGQTAARGRLVTEDLNSMSEVGFSPLSHWVEKSGKDMAFWRKEVEAGRFSFDMLMTSLEAKAREREGLMAKQSDTRSGQWSMLKSELGDSSSGLGGFVNTQIKEEIKNLRGLLKMLEGDFQGAQQISDGKNFFTRMGDSLRDWVMGIKEAEESAKKTATSSVTVRQMYVEAGYAMQTAYEEAMAAEAKLQEEIQKRADMERDANSAMQRAYNEAMILEEAQLEKDKKAREEEEARKQLQKQENALQEQIRTAEHQRSQLSRLQLPAAASMGSAEAYKAIAGVEFERQKAEAARNDPQVRAIKELKVKLEEIRKTIEDNKVARLRD